MQIHQPGSNYVAAFFSSSILTLTMPPAQTKKQLDDRLSELREKIAAEQRDLALKEKREVAERKKEKLEKQAKKIEKQNAKIAGKFDKIAKAGTTVIQPTEQALNAVAANDLDDFATTLIAMQMVDAIKNASESYETEMGIPHFVVYAMEHKAAEKLGQSGFVTRSTDGQPPRFSLDGFKDFKDFFKTVAREYELLITPLLPEKTVKKAFARFNKRLDQYFELLVSDMAACRDSMEVSSISSDDDVLNTAVDAMAPLLSFLSAVVAEALVVQEKFDQVIGYTEDEIKILLKEMTSSSETREFLTTALKEAVTLSKVGITGTAEKQPDVAIDFSKLQDSADDSIGNVGDAIIAAVQAAHPVEPKDETETKDAAPTVTEVQPTSVSVEFTEEVPPKVGGLHEVPPEPKAQVTTLRGKPRK